MTDILHDKTEKALVSMSLPISIGMLSTFLFQIVDTYFVGQLGANALAALSFSSTVYFLMVGLFIGLSVGISIIIGKAVGENDFEKVKKTALTGILLCLFLTVLFSSVLFFFIEPIFESMGASSEVLLLIKEYVIPLLFGMPLLTGGILSGGILRSTGNITKPEVMMAAAGVLNLIFDYVFIFGKFGFPEMGIKGAAFATVLSWVFMILGMFVLLIRDRLLSFTTKTNITVPTLLREIFSLSIPTVITQIIGPFTLIYLTFLLARESSMVVAAFGVAGRIEMLLMIGILAVSTATTPFIAQNSGAKMQDRIDKAIVFGGKASVYLGIMAVILLYVFIQPIAELFSDNTQVVAHTVNYFYIVSLSYVFYGLYLITSSVFNGLQLPVNSLKISLVKSLLFTFPFTFIGSFWGVTGIFIGLSLSNVFGGVYAAVQMRKMEKETDSALYNANVLEDYRNDIKQLFRRK